MRSSWPPIERTFSRAVLHVLGGASARFAGYLGLCAAYIQGGVAKLSDFGGAVGEMKHFGIAPASFGAVLVIILELSAPTLILSGRLRWLGALALAVFTMLATGIALRFWQLPPGAARFAATNAFFEHLGLVGGFLLVAWLDLQERME